MQVVQGAAVWRGAIYELDRSLEDFEVGMRGAVSVGHILVVTALRRCHGAVHDTCAKQGQSFLPYYIAAASLTCAVSQQG